MSKLITISRRGLTGARIWHAQRNVEMIAALAPIYLLRKELRTVFTSASQRQHARLTKTLIAQIEIVVAASAKSTSDLARPATIIHHGIHHGIDTETFATCTDKPDMRAKLDLPQGPLIGCYGRIRPRPGTNVFVDAMISLLPKHPESAAIVVGYTARKDHGFLDDLISLMRAAGLTNRILFLPEVPILDTPKYYQALDLFIAPQRCERV